MPINYQAIVHGLPSLVVILDAELKIVDVSDAYNRATMTRRDEMLGKSMFEVFPDNPDDSEADGINNLHASLRRVLKSAAPDTMAVQRYDVRNPQEQGECFEERYWTVINSPILGDDGQICYIIHKAEDVTEFIRLKQSGLEQHRNNAELSEQVALAAATSRERSKMPASMSANRSPSSSLLRCCSSLLCLRRINSVTSSAL